MRPGHLILDDERLLFCLQAFPAPPAQCVTSCDPASAVMLFSTRHTHLPGSLTSICAALVLCGPHAASHVLKLRPNRQLNDVDLRVSCGMTKPFNMLSTSHPDNLAIVIPAVGQGCLLSAGTWHQHLVRLCNPLATG